MKISRAVLRGQGRRKPPELPGGICKNPQGGNLKPSWWVGGTWDSRISKACLVYPGRCWYDDINPFNLIDSNGKESIDDLIVIRNQITHRSKMSGRKYQKLLDKYGCNDYMEPYFFLASLVSEPGTVLHTFGKAEERFFERYVAALRNASKAMVRHLNSVINSN